MKPENLNCVNGSFKWLLSGRPGVGKTTCMAHLAIGLGSVPVIGFITSEIRQSGKRMGFQIQPFKGNIALLAHVRGRSPWRVGRYFVFPEHLDEIIHSILAQESALGNHRRIYIIDEIGKMEAISPLFRMWVEKTLRSPWPVVATIALKGTKWIETVKQFPGVQIIILTEKNRELICQQLQQCLQQWLSQ